MVHYVLTHLSGIYVFDENLKIVEKKEVQFNVEDAIRIKRGELTEIEKKIFEELKNKYGDLVYLGKRNVGFDYTEDSKIINKAMNEIRKNLTNQVLAKIQEIQREVTIREISKSVTRDLLLIHAINALDDLNRIINLMVERFREWYGLYCPEISMAIEDHEKFVNKVLEKNKEELMRELGIKETMGGDLTRDDIETMKEYAKEIKHLYELRKRLIDYISRLMKEVAPNVCEVAGPLVGARLIALAGGLKQLALLPASTVQVLGAEKALFRHLRKHTPPPKHGVLFNHPLIQKLPKKLRGRMARTLAAKISIAAKVDAFSPGRYVGDKLRREVEERFEQLKSGKSSK